jgi:hypothetical protein
MPTRATSAEPQPIRLQVQTIAQLFHTLDPLPFRERDLDEAVEAYIVGSAGELPASHPIVIMVHLPEAEARRAETQRIDEGMRRYFAYRAEVAGWDLRDLFRTGRAALAIGLTTLALCIVAGGASHWLLGEGGYIRRFFDEGLIIIGWVANWRPIEIFLYDWWPIVRRRNLYLRLAEASVRLEPSPAP